MLRSSLLPVVAVVLGALAVCALLDARSARAQDTHRVAVLILGTGGVEPSTADELTELLVGTLAQRGGVEIVGKEEFQAQLGQTDQGSLDCVSSPACLGRIGVQLDVSEVIAGTVATRDGGWAFNLVRIDIRSGETAGRAFREVQGDLGALAGALSDAVPTLYEAQVRPAILEVRSAVQGAAVSLDGSSVGSIVAGSFRREGLEPGTHTLEVRAPGYAPFTRSLDLGSGATLQIDAELRALRGVEISPLVWVGAGTGLVFGGVGLGLGVASQATPPTGQTRAQAVSFLGARETEATLADVGYGLAAAGLVTAVIGIGISDFAGESAGVQAGVAPVPGGAVATVGGSL